MKYSERENYFWELHDKNIIGRLARLFTEAGYFIRREDGKIFTDRYRLLGDSVWHYTKVNDGDDCYRWHHVMFKFLGFVPSQCQECYKIVVRMNKIEQLFALLDLQIELGRPSKCGIEERDFVECLYGGYFYNRGLDEAIANYRIIKPRIEENPILAPILDEVDPCGLPKNFVIKRGCTEFEKACGRSDQWSITDEQLKWEELVNEYVAPIEFQDLPPHVINDMHWRWILYAAKNGDSTYKKFTGGKPINTPVVIYHFLAENIPVHNVTLEMNKEGELTPTP